jgi:hypothetical protein
MTPAETYAAIATQPRKACHGCPHYTPGWCKRYGAIIRNSEPVTRCDRRSIGVEVDMAAQQATREAMAGSDTAEYAGDTYRGR